MANKNKKKASAKRVSPKKNIILSLTLVPLIVGVILLGAWVLDLDLLGNPQSQVTVGIFFFLLAFIASNAVQKRWRLAAGWGFLAIADLVTLSWLNVGAQIIALGVGGIGVVFLGIEFYKQYKQGKMQKSH